MLSPHPHLRYSGTVPGWIAGQYARDTGVVDIAALARRAGARFVAARAAAIDPDGRAITCDDGVVIDFDIASIDTGGVGQSARRFGRDPRMLDIRPIDNFVERLEKAALVERVAVIGGGAGGVELAFALRNRAGARGGAGGALQVTLIAGSAGLLPHMAQSVRKRVRAQLQRQSIVLLEADARIEETSLLAGPAAVRADVIVAAIGSAAPDWPGAGGLACDADGFIAVDAFQRSTSHPHIFAAGDCARRMDIAVDHSGVHAVHTGPVLAANLRAVLAGRKISQTYAPRAAHLYLISTGQGEAIGSYGRFAFEGRCAAKLKHAIDMRWLSFYAALAKPI